MMSSKTPRPSGRLPLRSALAGFVGTLLLLSSAGCDTPAVAESPAGSPPDPEARVAARLNFVEVGAASENQLLTLPAEVTLPAGARLTMGPPVQGRLVAWRVGLGDVVDVDTPLADLVSPDLAGLDSREAELEQVVKARARVLRQRRRDVKAGFRTADVVQDARLALDEAKAQLARLKAERLSQRALMATATRAEAPEGDAHSGGGAPSAKEADVSGGRWTWTAGTAGVVEAITCPTGSVQPSTASCIRILSPERAELRIAIPERRLAELGDEVTAVWHPAAAPERSVAMVLTRRAPVVQSDSRTRDHYLVPRLAADRALLVTGATGTATLTTPVRSLGGAPTVRVPRSAVTDFEGRRVVFRASDAPLPEPVTISVVGRVDEDLLVRGDGLRATDRVASRGVFLLKSHLLLGGE